MTETGTNSGGTFSESVTGSDTPTLTEGGNTANQTFTRTVTIAGSYIRTDSGPGATLASGSGTIGASSTETADARSGILSQTRGSDRYSLLEHFNDVSNTTSGNQPGNMNFYAFGQPFVDPGERPVFVAPWNTSHDWVMPWNENADWGTSKTRIAGLARGMRWRSRASGWNTRNGRPRRLGGNCPRSGQPDHGSMAGRERERNDELHRIRHILHIG
jgi:hypothetical protein